MCLAVFLSVASVTVAAQTTFDFEDPLDEIRAKIERTSPDGVTGSAADLDGDTATNRTDQTNAANVADASDPIASFAKRLGLPTAGLVGLGVLGLLALLLGLMWLINRRKAAKTISRKDRELYAVANGSRARRTLESGAKVSRNRKHSLDTDEAVAVAAAPSAASAAARILSDEPASAELEFVDEPAPAETVAANPVTSDPAVNPDDPDTWKRPNLDRLKASIRDDWAGSKPAPAEPEPAPMQSEAEAFADLFGADDTATHVAETQKSPVLDMLDTFETASEPKTVAELRAAAAESTEENLLSGETRAAARPALPSRSDAVRRIRALRESVKAG